MIQKELIKTREDGVNVYVIYSDKERKIRQISTSRVFNGANVSIHVDEEYEELEELIDIKGAPDNYDGILRIRKEREMLSRRNATLDRTTERTKQKINRLNLTDNEALTVKEFYPTWESKIGKTIEVGYITLYEDRLWRARQSHTALEIYPPSLLTASLYEVIEYQHEGTIWDPIPYQPPMEIFDGKCYEQDGIIYQCMRDSGVALSHDLNALVGLYVELA